MNDNPFEKVKTHAPRQQPIERKDKPEKVHVGAYFAPEVWFQVKDVAHENRTSVKATIGKALNCLFLQHGKQPIAPEK